MLSTLGYLSYIRRNSEDIHCLKEKMHKYKCELETNLYYGIVDSVKIARQTN